MHRGATTQLASDILEACVCSGAGKDAAACHHLTWNMTVPYVIGGENTCISTVRALLCCQVTHNRLDAPEYLSDPDQLESAECPREPRGEVVHLLQTDVPRRYP